jgi:hypothetical protein
VLTCNLARQDTAQPTWHSVVSDTKRYSLGFKIKSDEVAKAFMKLAEKTYV